MANQPEKTVEALEAELLACKARLHDLEQRVAAPSHPTPPPPSAIDLAERDQLRVDLAQQSLELRVFKNLSDHSRDALCVAGLDRRIRYANAMFRSMTGFGDRAIGALTSDFLDESEANRSLAEARLAIADKGYWVGTMRYRRPDGSVWLPQGHIVLLRDEAGVPYAYTGAYRDVTEQLQSEAALRESEARSRALLDAIPDLLFLLTGDGVYVDYRAEHKDQLRLPPDQFIGRRLEEVLPPDLAAWLRAILREALATRQPQNIEYSLEVVGGKRDFEGKVVACGEDLVLLTAHDVTDRKRAEEERRALQAEVIAAKDAALRELATPIFPVADGIIAMPLIGAIDPVRASQILEALLAGITAHHVRIAILDVTGVKDVDAEIARSLVRAAQAARLLGAQVMLTGISPKVAQTLIGLQADLGGILTYGTLKAGIAHALR